MTTAERTLLLGIGATKAGTTWLSQYLRAHPEVFVSSIKELHFFDTQFQQDREPEWLRRFYTRFQQKAASLTFEQAKRKSPALGVLQTMLDRLSMRTDEDYMRFFTERAGESRVMSEITPGYCMLDRDSFRRMAALPAQVRFVFLMRNPAERIWSDLRFSAGRGDAGPDADVLTAAGRPPLRLRTDYVRTLNELYAAVPPEAVHVEFYENLFSDEAIARFCAFAGIAFAAGEYDSRVNAAPVREMPPDLRPRVLALYAHVYRHMAAIYPERLPENWRRDLDAIEAGRVSEPSPEVQVEDDLMT